MDAAVESVGDAVMASVTFFVTATATATTTLQLRLRLWIGI